jgi:hypothetical protein
MKKEDSTILVSIIEAPKKDGSGEVETLPLTNAKYGEWSNVCLNEKEFQNEIILRSTQYLNEVVEINPKLQNSNRMKRLRELISTVIKH